MSKFINIGFANDPDLDTPRPSIWINTDHITKVVQKPKEFWVFLLGSEAVTITKRDPGYETLREFLNS